MPPRASCVVCLKVSGGPKWLQTGGEIFQRLLVEIGIAVIGEEAAVDVAVGEPVEDGERLRLLLVGRGCWKVQNGGRNPAGDQARGVGRHLIGEHDDGRVIIGKNDVFGDKARDFSRVLNDVVTIALAYIHSQAVTGAVAVLEQDRGEHLLVRAGSSSERLIMLMSQSARSWGGMASSPAANIQPAPSSGAGALRSEGVALVAGGVGRRQFAGIGVVDVVHAQRQKDPFLQ